MVLGRPVDKKEVRSVLGALGLERGEGKGADTMWFVPPTWRVDLALEEDLIDEIARVSGFDSVPTVMPPLPTQVWTTPPEPDEARRLRQMLSGAGLHENVALAFQSPAHVAAVGGELARAVALENPLGEESSLMRMSLLPGLLRAAALNQALMRTDVRLFELGTTFAWGAPPRELPEETRALGILIRGRRAPAGWASGSAPADVYDVKAAVELLLSAYRIGEPSFVPVSKAWLHPRSSTQVEAGGLVLGVFGEIHPDAMRAFELEGAPVFVAELSVDALVGKKGARSKMRPLAKYPSAARDLSFFIGREVTSEQILRAVRGSGAGHLADAAIFDVYEGKNLPEGKRSIAVAMTFRSDQRTLTDAEIEGDAARVERALEHVGAQIRRA
jgi:phenylalanyl-tRNA synthetase beta chain